MTWFYIVGGKRVGPVDTDELVRRILESDLPTEPRDIQIWKQGMLKWAAAGDVPEIAGRLPPPILGVARSSSDMGEAPWQPTGQGQGVALPVARAVQIRREEPHSLNPFVLYSRCFKFWRGGLSRAEYTSVVLSSVLAAFGGGILIVGLLFVGGGGVMTPLEVSTVTKEALGVMWILCALPPLLGGTIKRLRDLGKTPWYMLVFLIPCGGFVMIALLMWESGARDAARLRVGPQDGRGAAPPPSPSRRDTDGGVAASRVGGAVSRPQPSEAQSLPAENSAALREPAAAEADELTDGTKLLLWALGLVAAILVGWVAVRVIQQPAANPRLPQGDEAAASGDGPVDQALRSATSSLPAVSTTPVPDQATDTSGEPALQRLINGPRGDLIRGEASRLLAEWDAAHREYVVQAANRMRMFIPADRNPLLATEQQLIALWCAQEHDPRCVDGALVQGPGAVPREEAWLRLLEDAAHVDAARTQKRMAPTEPLIVEPVWCSIHMVEARFVEATWTRDPEQLTLWLLFRHDEHTFKR